MTFRTEEQDRITRRGLAAARAALATAGRPATPTPTHPDNEDPTRKAEP